jgi:sugar O-acyltransferase (sialic acid O-acetyltransferase NeuD family)
MTYKSEKIVIIGASGSSLDIYSIIKQINEKNNTYEVLGFLEDQYEKINIKYKKKIIGKLNDANKFKDVFFAIGIGNERNFLKRENLIKSLNLSLDKFPNIIHPTAIINNDTIIGNGNIFHAYVTVSRDVIIKDFVNILPKTTINHDVIINSYSIINSNSIISGDVTIGKSCYIGQGANIRDHVRIEDNILVGMGSVVTKNLEANRVYLGNPAKIFKNSLK